MKKIYLKIVLIMTMIGCTNIISAQEIKWECVAIQNSNNNFEQKSSNCHDLSNLTNYLLDKGGNIKYDQTPKYTINCKIHVIQYSNETPRNYTISSVQDLKEGIENITFRFKNLTPPSISEIPMSEEESDACIRLKVESVDFLQDKNLYRGTFDSLHVVNYQIANIPNSHTIEIAGNVVSTLGYAGQINYPQRIVIENSSYNNGIYKYDKSSLTYNSISNTTTVHY